VLVDHYSDDWDTLWWVRLRGDAEVREEADPALLAPLVAKYEHYRAQPPAGPVIVVHVADVTAWTAGGD
jgi:hypothetical protein